LAIFTPFIATHTVRLIRKTKRFFALLSLLLLAPHFLFAQEKGTKVSQEVIKIQPLEGEIELDGRLSETIWSQIVPFPMTQLVPIHEAEMSEETQIYMTYDAKYVYIAAKNLTNKLGFIFSWHFFIAKVSIFFFVFIHICYSNQPSLILYCKLVLWKTN